MNKKKIEKIYKKIDSFAKQGVDYELQYKEYIDYLVKEGDYAFFIETLERKYGIDVLDYSFDNVKNRTFNQIRFQTTSEYQDNLKSLFDKYSLYRIGQNAFNSNNENIGKVIEEGPKKKIEANKLNFDFDGVSALYIYKPDMSYILLDDKNQAILEKYEIGIKFLLGI